MIYRFESITRSYKLTQKCAAGCGKRITRTVTYSETVNPFNLTPDGSPKSRDEVVASVREGLNAACASAVFTCKACAS